MDSKKSEEAEYQSEVLKKHWTPRDKSRLRPDPNNKRSVLHTLEPYMRVFVHQVPDPRSAVERFTDGCLEKVEWTLKTAYHPKEHAVFVEKPTGLVVFTTNEPPFEILGFFDAKDLDPRRHRRNNAWVVPRYDPIWKHPKQLLDEHYRGKNR